MSSLPIGLALLAFQAPSSPTPPVQDDDAPVVEEGERQESPSERARREREERLRAAEAENAPAIGLDGKPLVPGMLPADATDAARAEWGALCQAVLAPEPVRAFDLSFYLLQRQETLQSNTVEARIRFLAPGYVRSVITTSRRELVRGPNGDWLLDNRERIKLVGREGAEDKKQLDEIVGIARNFAALTDPASLRIATLEVLTDGPRGLPADVRERGSALRWLAVTSPDFRLYRTPAREPGAPPPMFRALLGLDPETHRVELALIHEAGSESVMIATTLLVHLKKFDRHADFLVPREIDVYQIDSRSRPWSFRARPASELVLRDKGLDLRPPLVPADFAVAGSAVNAGGTPSPDRPR